MTVLVRASALPAIITAAGDRAELRYLEFFAATIRNPNTRRAYSRAVSDFLEWCAGYGVPSIADVQPLHVATWVEQQTKTHAAPTVKQRLAAVRQLFDWLVTGQIVPVNPTASVRGPSHSVKRGKTPVLAPEEARTLIDSIDVSKPAGLRDRALIGMMVYSFARVGAALGMKVEDVYVQNRRLWLRLHEKGGKRHEMPCHHNLEEYLTAYLDGAGLRDDPKGPLFRTIGRGTDRLTDDPPHPAGGLHDDPPAGEGGGHRHADRQPQFPGDGDHRLPEERRHDREGGRHGQSLVDAHDAALRSALGRGDARRGRAGADLVIGENLKLSTRMDWLEAAHSESSGHSGHLPKAAIPHAFYRASSAAPASSRG